MESDEESEELVYYQLIFGFLTCVQAFLYWRMFCVARSGDDETQLTAATACSSFMDVASLGRVILLPGAALNRPLAANQVLLLGRRVVNYLSETPPRLEATAPARYHRPAEEELARPWRMRAGTGFGWGSFLSRNKAMRSTSKAEPAATASPRRSGKKKSRKCD